MSFSSSVDVRARERDPSSPFRKAEAQNFLLASQITSPVSFPLRDLLGEEAEDSTTLPIRYVPFLKALFLAQKSRQFSVFPISLFST